MRTARRYLSTVLAVLAVTAGPAATNVLKVGPGVDDDFPTLQGAVDAAVDGDTLDIAMGEYVEQIRIVGKDLTLRSRNGFSVSPQGNLVINPEELLASGTTFTGRRVHAAILVEQATVHIEFLQVRADRLTTRELNAADIPAGIAALGPGASVHVRHSRVTGYGKGIDSTTTVDSPCGLVHVDHYSQGVGVLAYDADAVTARSNALSNQVPLAAVCTGLVDIFSNTAATQITFPTPAIQIVGDGAVARQNRLHARAVGILVTGDAGTFSRNHLRSPLVGLRLEGNDHSGVNNFLEGAGTPVEDLGSGSSVGFREHGFAPARGTPAPPAQDR